MADAAADAMGTRTGNKRSFGSVVDGDSAADNDISSNSTALDELVEVVTTMIEKDPSFSDEKERVVNALLLLQETAVTAPAAMDVDDDAMDVRAAAAVVASAAAANPVTDAAPAAACCCPTYFTIRIYKRCQC